MPITENDFVKLAYRILKLAVQLRKPYEVIDYLLSVFRCCRPAITALMAATMNAEEDASESVKACFALLDSSIDRRDPHWVIEYALAPFRDSIQPPAIMTLSEEAYSQACYGLAWMALELRKPLSVIENLISAKPQIVERVSASGLTLLHPACEYRAWHTVAFLIARNPDAV